MLGFGDHLQYSVFECQFTPTDQVRCRHALGKVRGRAVMIEGPSREAIELIQVP